MVISIPLAIMLDVFIQHAGAPIEYTAETAHAEEVAPKEVQIEVVIDWTKDRINQEIEKKAKEYGTSATTLKRIVECESGYVTDVQSHHILSYGREKSFGLAQIHLPSHPDVTYEEAVDPEFAINYLAKNYAQHTDKWSCK
jgi:hypothetical protein